MYIQCQRCTVGPVNNDNHDEYEMSFHAMRAAISIAEAIGVLDAVSALRSNACSVQLASCCKCVAINVVTGAWRASAESQVVP